MSANSGAEKLLTVTPETAKTESTFNQFCEKRLVDERMTKSKNSFFIVYS
jgi:hypothetical protein